MPFEVSVTMCHCGRPGLYRAEGQVFCRAHRHEAIRVMRQRQGMINRQFQLYGSPHDAVEASLQQRDNKRRLDRYRRGSA